jgi:hypothetical protein
MKKRKILIIFLLSLFTTFIIYKIFSKDRTNILLIGDNSINSLTNKNYSYYLKKDIKINDVNEIFTSDYKNYRDIENNIKNNYYIYFKSKKIYLNQEINNNKIIIFSANNDEYLLKCKKSNSVLKNYNKKIYDSVVNIIKLVNRISTAKIIIIGNYCSEYNKEISDYLNNLYKDYNYINMYELYNKYFNNNMEYHLYKAIINRI